MPGILQQRLQLETPIIQAPMAGVQDAALAAAVSTGGGLGSLPCAMLGAEQIEDQLGQLAGVGPVNVNFFCHHPVPPDAAREAAWREALAPYYREFEIDPATIADAPARRPFDDAALALIERFTPAVVSFHFGLPASKLLQAVRASGALVLSSATTVDEARWLAEQGVDAIIAQGLEAGGHRGMFLDDDLGTQCGSLALLPQIVSAVDIPVIAAGGIADADSAAAAIRLGADAVQVGTAFLLCDEATTSAVHRSVLTSPESRHTTLTNRFSGRPARGIVNRLLRELGPLGDVPAFPLAAGALAPLRAAPEARGSGDFSPLWSGQNATGCRAIPAAEQLAGIAQGC